MDQPLRRGGQVRQLPPLSQDGLSQGLQNGVSFVVLPVVQGVFQAPQVAVGVVPARPGRQQRAVEGLQGRLRAP